MNAAGYVQTLKQNLEREVRNAVYFFQRETGLTVAAVHVRFDDCRETIGGPPNQRIEVTVEIRQL